MHSPRATTPMGFGSRPSSATPKMLRDRYVADIMATESNANTSTGKPMNAYQWWELHKLQTHTRSLVLQQQMQQQTQQRRTDKMMSSMRSSSPRSDTSTTDWYVLTGITRPSGRSRWLKDDLGSNEGGPPYAPPDYLQTMQMRPYGVPPPTASPRRRPGSARVAGPTGAPAPPMSPRPGSPRSPRPGSPRVAGPQSVPMGDVVVIQQAVSSVENAVNTRFTKMRDAFRSLDLDRSGTIGREELKRALVMWNIPDVDGTVLDALMSACDADSSGSVDYKEFVDVLARDKVVGKAVVKSVVSGMVMGDPVAKAPAAAAARPAPLITAANAVSSAENALNTRFKNMHAAFRAIDLDRSGEISQSEMRRALELWNIPVTGTLDIIMSTCDKDGNGIDYKEFVQVLARDKHAGAAVVPSVHEVHNQTQNVLVKD